MKIGRGIRRALEITLTRAGMFVLPPLPRRAILALATLLAGAAYLLACDLRRVGLVNLDIAFGATRSPREKRRILRQSFKSFALVILDVFWFSRRSHERLRKYLVFDRPFLDHLFQEEPQVCVTAHLGNWEVLGQAVTDRGFKLASVAAPLANESVDNLFNALRSRTGQTIVPQKGAVRKLIQALRDGAKVALVLDQNTKPSRGGIFVPFFGLEVPVSTAAASLLIHTGAGLFLGFCIPRADGSYHARAPQPGEPRFPAEPRDKAVAGLTEEITRIVEEEIRRNPGCWLWMYKRWKYVAPGRRREEYPFYAKELVPEERDVLGN